MFFCLILGFSKSVKGGINKFTTLIFVEEWLIERKIDLRSNEVNCRASLPSNATWFGARIRLGPNDELIKPRGIQKKGEEFGEFRLTTVKKVLKDCRSGLLFLPEK